MRLEVRADQGSMVDWISVTLQRPQIRLSHTIVTIKHIIYTQVNTSNTPLNPQPLFKVSTQPFLLSKQQNSRKSLSTLPLTGNNLRIYGNAIARGRHCHGDGLYSAGRWVEVKGVTVGQCVTRTHVECMEGMSTDRAQHKVDIIASRTSHEPFCQDREKIAYCDTSLHEDVCNTPTVYIYHYPN